MSCVPMSLDKLAGTSTPYVQVGRPATLDGSVVRSTKGESSRCGPRDATANVLSAVAGIATAPASVATAAAAAGVADDAMDVNDDSSWCTGEPANPLACDAGCVRARGDVSSLVRNDSGNRCCAKK